MKRLIPMMAIILTTHAVWAQTPRTASKQVQLVFAGDTTLDSTPGALIKQGADPLKDFGELFAQAEIGRAHV